MAAENDIVLVYNEDQPVVFARVEEIRPDVKKDWFQIKLMLLQVPVQTVTWILRDTYINGGEFTMGGNRMRLEKIEPPEEQEEQEEQISEKQEAGTSRQDGTDDSGGTVISLKDRKPK